MGVKKWKRTGWKAEPPIEVRCDGGCGKTQSIRKRRIRKAAFYVCSHICEAKLPRKPEVFVRVVDYNACGGFTGITDRAPSPWERAAIERARFLRDIAMEQLRSDDVP